MTTAFSGTMMARPAAEVWQPVFFAAGPELDELRRSGTVDFTYDEIVLQLSELVQFRSPARKLSDAEIRARVEKHIGDADFASYGDWVYYPWSRRLVHLVPESEFRELRTNSNRYKITEEEQIRLRRAHLGIVGLSVGQATAITLALEGIGGSFRLADFDILNLGNMNRLRAGVHSLGVNKAVLTAREIFEIDPYLDIALFPEGITESNIEAFLDGLDLLFEESDDLRMKVLLRERARAKRIPVVMETNDRGLLDVERYDLEPDRPLFHGLIGAVDKKKLDGLTAYEKVPIAFAIVGPTLSPRMAASFLDISTKLTTWPQLASGVALSGAVNTDTARRILLGQFTESGRFFVDLESIVKDGGGKPPEAPAVDVAAIPMPEPLPEIAPGTAPDITPGTAPDIAPTSGRSSSPRRITPDQARTLLAYGVRAPSGGNCQPWKFVLRQGRIVCLHDVARSSSFLDFEHGAAYLAFGALARNVELVAAEMRQEIQITSFTEPDVVCAIEAAAPAARAGRAASQRDELVRHIAERTTNRRLGPRIPLQKMHREKLLEAARRAGARLQLIEDEPRLRALGALVGKGDRLRCLSPIMHREMMAELRWTHEEARARRDGLDLATLELTPADLVGVRLISNESVVQFANHAGVGLGLEQGGRRAILGSSAACLLTIPGQGPEAYFAGGRAMQDVWLAATAQRIGLQPMTALIYMFARLERGGGCGFSPEECIELRALRHAFRESFDIRENETELLLFRLSYAAPPSARSLRRTVDDLLVIEAS